MGESENRGINQVRPYTSAHRHPFQLFATCTATSQTTLLRPMVDPTGDNVEKVLDFWACPRRRAPSNAPGLLRADGVGVGDAVDGKLRPLVDGRGPDLRGPGRVAVLD